MTLNYSICAICGATIIWEHGKQPENIEVIKRRGHPTLVAHKTCIEKERKANEHIKSEEDGKGRK